ncbi:acyltransferase family protein [Microbacterium sp. NPDC055683]
MASTPAAGIRTDIQALRAYAVLAVLLNHLWPEHAPGGYIGVDVFFVISGYLITAHLLREHAQTGRISFSAFWARRAKRLLPASLLVLLVSAVIAVTIIPEAARQDDLTQIGWAAAYVLNWALSMGSLDYFAQESSQTLVVHYWSLSVEEQFYLVWPVLIAAALAVAAKKMSGRHRQALLTVIGSVAIASFAYAIWGVGEKPEAIYFETTARAWEFAVGGLLALLPAVKATWARVGSVILWLAWVLLILCVFVFDPSSGVPGWAALLPVIATAAVIVIGEAEGEITPRPLTNLRAVQWLGDVSYSAYLWHFPLIVAAPYLLGTWLSAIDKVSILALTIFLAFVTKRYVEDPVRFRVLRSVSPKVILTGAVVSVVVLGGGLVGGVHVAAERAEAAAQSLLEEAQSAGPECFGAQAVLSGAECASSHVLADPSYLNASPDETLNEEDDVLGALTCTNEERGEGVVRICREDVAAADVAGEIALIGDSHLMVWRDAIRATARDLDMHVSTYFRAGCPPTLDLDIFAKDGADREDCENWKEPAIHGIADDPTIDVVVTSAWADSYRTADGEKDDGSGYVEAWQLWLDAGKTVIVLNDTPRLEGTIVDCILEDGVGSVDPCSRPREQAVTQTLLERAAGQIDDERLHFVDYTNVFCDDRCHAVIGGIPAYRDSHHVSVPLTRSFGTEAFRPELEAALEAET